MKTGSDHRMNWNTWKSEDYGLILSCEMDFEMSKVQDMRLPGSRNINKIL
jgi:hypothetical protein